MSAHFITFGSAQYEPTLRRIESQAKTSGWFSTVIAYRERDISASASKEWIFRPENRRGFGYWLWKSEFILRRLREIPDNDYLVYCDAGCTVNAKGVRRWNEYKTLISPETNKDLLCFQMRHLDIHWTKAETIRICGVDTLDASVLHTGQIIGGILVLRNTAELRDFYEGRRRLLLENLQIIDDSPSPGGEQKGFREHRHDQSVMSLSIKSLYKTRAVLIPDETFPSGTPPDWKKLCHIPFLASRIRR